MKRALRIVPLAAVIAAVAFSASASSAGNGSVVLKATLASNFLFDVNGVATFYTFTCNETRVQQKDGSASESVNCRIDPWETPPATASPATQNVGWFSDFAYWGVPGFAGPNLTNDYHGVLTPSGVVNLSATYAAP